MIETVPAAAHELVLVESTGSVAQPVASKRLDDTTELFLDRMRTVNAEAKNREQHDEREHHVTVLAHCWENREGLSKEQRGHGYLSRKPMGYILRHLLDRLLLYLFLRLLALFGSVYSMRMTACLVCYCFFRVLI